MTAALRTVVEAGPGTRLVIDLVALGKGRTEITLTVAAPVASTGALARAEQRLARRLVARLRT